MSYQTEGELRISVYSWNSASMKIEPETTLGGQISRNRETYRVQNPEQLSGHIADFMSDILEQINRDRPDIVFFASQEAAGQGDYLHSQVLSKVMSKVTYSELDLVKKAKTIGPSSPYIKLLSGGASKGLKSSVYALPKIAQDIKKAEYNDRRKYGDEFQIKHITNQSQGYGGIGTYLRIPGFGLTCLINCQLPINPDSLTEYLNTDNPYLRKSHVFDNDKDLNRIIHNIAFKPSIDYGPNYEPNYVIIAGDLNYRVTIPDPKNNRGQTLFTKPVGGYKSLYPKYDELRNSMKSGNIPVLLEGVDKKGPQFMPTCPLVKGREPGDTSISAYNLGEQEQYNPSWCDRILYTNLKAGGDIVADVYNRYDLGSMTNSDHCGVRAIFDITKVRE